MIVQFTADMTDRGEVESPIKNLTVLASNSAEMSVDFSKRPDDDSTAPATVIARVLGLSRNKLRLEVPKSDVVRRGRLNVELTEDADMQIFDDSLNRVQPGDEVTNAQMIEFNTGDKVIRNIKIKLAAEREKIKASFEDKLEQEFSNLSDQPGQPREVRSQNFVLYTDISDRQAQVLLAKLETMHGLIGGYFGKRPRMPIECYVVDDMQKWPPGQIDPIGVAKIMEPAGVTRSRSLPGSREMKAVVYSCDDHDVVQHEAVHAFCTQAFGSTGPTWYSEGMAEMGNYWKPGQLEVNIDPVVITYLTEAEPKKMLDIVAAGQITGDSWQAYAWRWALCHLLANNSNYAKRFKQLGLVMMSGGKETFETAFGSVAKEISFEYDQFVQNFGNGYRVDLCAWDWSVRPKKLSGSGRQKTEVLAQAGWQPTKLLTQEGVSYDHVAEGEWKLSPTDKPITADGGGAGRGRLIGALLQDYESEFRLSKPFEMGARGSFTAPGEGQLYVRCRDGWTDLADNEGELTLHLRRTPEE